MGVTRGPGQRLAVSLGPVRLVAWRPAPGRKGAVCVQVGTLVIGGWARGAGLRGYYPGVPRERF